MRPSLTRLRLLVLLALGLVGGACKQPDTILFVTVAGPNNLPANQLSVLVSIGDGETHAILVPKDPGDFITLTASFTVALPSSAMAPVTVMITANYVHADGTFDTVGAGITTTPHIYIGGQTDVAVFLSPPLPPDMPDGGAGGADGGAGQGGAGQGGAGTGGGAGAGGAGGAAGQGGASGKDAGGGTEDATGLDAATE